MKQNEIMELGVQAGLCDKDGILHLPYEPLEYDFKDQILAFAKLVKQAEREACERVAEQELGNTASLTSMPPKSSAAWNILQAIRARGQDAA